MLKRVDVPVFAPTHVLGKTPLAFLTILVVIVVLLSVIVALMNAVPVVTDYVLLAVIVAVTAITKFAMNVLYRVRDVHTTMCYVAAKIATRIKNSSGSVTSV